MAKSWYAVHTIAGHEQKVRDVLTRRAMNAGLWDSELHEILIPTEQELRTRGGKSVVVNKKVFPGYILVRMSLTDDSFKLVRSTAGVTSFVQSGNKPIPLTDEEVQRILSNLAATQDKPKIAFDKSDVIRVATGPFADYTGKIEEVYLDREKIKVMINIFGRDTPVELDFTQVEKM